MKPKSKLLLTKPTDIFIYDTVTSTNDVIKTIPDSNKDVLVIAKQQTKGKGRYNKSFASPLGGIYMSYRIKKKLPIPQLIMTTALAVVMTLKDENIHAQIKWLNDIYIKDKKVAGILCESTQNFYIIGIGLNVYNTLPSYLSQSTTLKKHTDKILDLNSLISSIINHFNELLYQDPNSTLNLYKENNLLLKKSFITKSKTLQGIDILKDGSLVVKDEENNITLLDFNTTSIESINYEN